MEQPEIWIGKSQVNISEPNSAGDFVEIDKEKYYKISDFNFMPDFFISIVSDSNHWMFLSSNGSLTCGRTNRDNALFPYYTDDKIHDYRGQTGSRSIFLVNKKKRQYLWEPFTKTAEQFYQITRNIYKSIFGNKIIFEEINHDLKLRFRYGWANSEQFGFVKKSALSNLSKTDQNIKLLDGIQNILPAGVGYHFQNEYSNLLDAYKKNEKINDSSLAVFSLSSIPIDRAEPSESLRATTVWSTGLGKSYKILLSENQIENFRNGQKIKQENDIRARRGAYLVYSNLDIAGKKEKKWAMVAEVNQDSTAVANLNHFILSAKKLQQKISEDIDQGTTNLQKMVASADGLQQSATEITSARHFTNTLFNIMRGGVFADNYNIDVNEFKNYLYQINKKVANKSLKWLEQTGDKINYIQLLEKAKESGDADLQRIVYEYLPLIFSRRHGDPSRPWNIFSIETKDENGKMRFNYQGNWRDIFQNWEALLWSFPQFTEGIISKFLNASTIDGYNPYRIMRNGIDWERPDPEDPWVYIGYWGDHQIIYLQKLLELSHSFHPGKIEELLTKELFTYANVPYRIKPYEAIVVNPKDTVEFDFDLDKNITSETDSLGADAKLLTNEAGIYQVNFTEKILVTLLSKLSNFIPEAGIWLNTQRPEWNDANNALVGNGTSMVTLYYLRRFLTFWHEELRTIHVKSIRISEELAELYNEIHAFLEGNLYLTDSGFSNQDRKKFADFLGSAHSNYRRTIYKNSFSGIKIPVNVTGLISFINICLKYMDQSIRVNRRKDGLYHAYNLISINEKSVSIRYLYEMLEGQVAVLSAGILSPSESLEVLDALKASKIYREDQYSYMLYPDRELPTFTEKNLVSKAQVQSSELLSQLVKDNDQTIIREDKNGDFHFHSNFRNADGLKTALDSLSNSDYKKLLEKDREKVLNIYETVFDHQSFTGRSGTFYGYEGLGSIYWHMVSKLLLATQENYFRAVAENSGEKIIQELRQHYYEIKAGIGFYKKPDIYGAFPTDAYSHTPGNAGVKQPGLTGQVKEDVISRFQELGLHVVEGKMVFKPDLINGDEFLDQPQTFTFVDIKGEIQKLKLKSGQLAFTFCQVPIVICKSNESKIRISKIQQNDTVIDGNTIGTEESKMVFERSGSVKMIYVQFDLIKSK